MSWDTVNGIIAYIKDAASLSNPSIDHAVKGNKFYSEGKYSAAAKAYTAALTSGKLNDEQRICVLYNLGNAFLYSGEYNEAVGAYNKIFYILGDDYPKPYYKLTKYDRFLDYFDGQLRPVQKKLLYDVYFNLATSCLRAAEKAEAKAVSDGAGAMAYSGITNLYHHAFMNFMHAVELFPDDKDGMARIRGQESYQKMKTFQDKIDALPEYSVYNGTVVSLKPEPEKVDSEKLAMFQNDLSQIKPFEKPELSEGKLELEDVSQQTEGEAVSDLASAEAIPEIAAGLSDIDIDQVLAEINVDLDSIVEEAEDKTPEELAVPKPAEERQDIATEPIAPSIPEEVQKLMAKTIGSSKVASDLKDMFSDLRLSPDGYMPNVDGLGLYRLAKPGRIIGTYAPSNRGIFFLASRYDRIGPSGVKASDVLPIEPKLNLFESDRIVVSQELGVLKSVDASVGKAVLPLLIPSGGVLDASSFNLPEGSYRVFKTNSGQFVVEFNEAPESGEITYQVALGNRLPPDEEAESKFLNEAGSVYVDLPFSIDYSLRPDPEDPSLEEFLAGLESDPAISDLDKVRRLRGWFFDNINYSLDKSTAKLFREFYSLPDDDPNKNLANFTLKHRLGDCDTVNTAFISVVRDRFKLPARLVTGFVGKEGNVEITSAHGWSEVYIKGLGWLTFDATPPLSEADAAKLAKLSLNLPSLGVSMPSWDRDNFEDKKTEVREEVTNYLFKIIPKEIEAGDYSFAGFVKLEAYLIKNYKYDNFDTMLHRDQAARFLILETMQKALEKDEPLSSSAMSFLVRLRREYLSGRNYPSEFNQGFDALFFKHLLRAFEADAYSIGGCADVVVSLLKDRGLFNSNKIVKFLSLKVIKSDALILVDDNGLRLNKDAIAIVTASRSQELIRASFLSILSSIRGSRTFLIQQENVIELVSLAANGSSPEDSLKALLSVLYKDGKGLNKDTRFSILLIMLNSRELSPAGLKILESICGSSDPFRGSDLETLINHVPAKDVSSKAFEVIFDSGEYDDFSTFVVGEFFHRYIVPGKNKRFEHAVDLLINFVGPDELLTYLPKVNCLDRGIFDDYSARDYIVDTFLTKKSSLFTHEAKIPRRGAVYDKLELLRADEFLFFMISAFKHTSPEFAESKIDFIRGTLSSASGFKISEQEARGTSSSAGRLNSKYILELLDAYVESQARMVHAPIGSGSTRRKREMTALKVSQAIIQEIVKYDGLPRLNGEVVKIVEERVRNVTY